MDRGVSPAGGDVDGFALRGDLLCPCRQSRQSATGGRRLEKHSVFLCRLPRTPVYLRGSHQGVWKNLPGAGKGQDTAPRAARCRSMSLERAYTPTRAIAPTFQPSRGGSVVAPPPWLVLNTQNCREPAPTPGPPPPAVSSTAGLFWRGSFQVTANPWGVHPIGGTAVPPVLGRFKEGGFQRGEGNRNPSPL